MYRILVPDEKIEHQFLTSTPMANFLYALKAPETRRQYPKRFEYFLDFIKIGGSNVEEKSITFLKKAKENKEWLHQTLIWFISRQKQRAVERKISESTIPN